jgi:hypothetical protein
VTRELADLALAFGYLSKALPTDVADIWRERSLSCLNQASQWSSEEPARQSTALFGGLTGLGWIMEHLTAMLRAPSLELGSHADEDPAADIDRLLTSRLRVGAWPGVYDLIAGLVGIGVYFLERLPRPTAREGLHYVLSHLERTAVRLDGCLSWHSSPHLMPHHQRLASPNGNYNLGVAHGVPAIAYLLAELIHRDIEAVRALSLLDGLIEWMLRQRRPETSLQRFGVFVVPGKPQEDSRLAWCYGDLGIGGVLLHISQRLQRNELESVATDLLDRSILRDDIEGLVRDTPLCHGALGIAHVFNRTFHRTASVRYRDAAILWIERGLQMRLPGFGISGFYNWRADLPGFKGDSVSLLDGASGVMLALLAACTAVEPHWDRLLAISST